MRYIQLITRACRIVIDHPILWVLGLFMAAGFNINWLYLNTLTHSNTVDRMLTRTATILQDSSWARILLSGIIAVIVLVIASLVKIIFWQRSHRIIHDRAKGTCDVCHRLVDQPDSPPRARSVLIPVTIISIATAVVNTLLTLAMYQLFSWQGVSSLSAVVMICSLIIAAGISLSSVIAILFMIIQRQSLNNATRLTIDLLRRHWTALIEFTLTIMLLYGVCVVVGSAIIGLSQNGFTHLLQSVHSVIALPRVVAAILASIATAVFWVWFAVTNACSNMALLLLFGELVYPAASPEAELSAVKAPASV
jgi:hypothetical protein